MSHQILVYFALGVALAAFIFALALLIFTLRWRMAFVINDSQQKLALVPSNVLDRNEAALNKNAKDLEKLGKLQRDVVATIIGGNEDLAKALIASNEEVRVDQRKVFQEHQKALEVLEALREETKILRSEIQSQAQELERHRQGYDVDILSSSLIPIARMHRLITRDLEKNDLSEDAKTTLTALEDEHFDILETKGVKLIEPPVGARYRDQQNIKHPPITEKAPDASSAGLIKAVISPAYELPTSARNVVLLGAKVIVYSSPVESGAEVANEDSNQTGGDQHG